MPTVKSSPENIFDISTVSRLTGLSAANLRIWEKRYNAVAPSRSESGRRRYTESDLHRLQLLKRLSDASQPIGTTAQLPTEQLESRLQQGTAGAGQGEASPETARPSVLFVGGLAWDHFEADQDLSGRLQVVSHFGDLDEAEAMETDVKAELLVVEIVGLFADTLVRVCELAALINARSVLVIYNFARKRFVDELESDLRRTTVIRGPVSARQLRNALMSEINFVVGIKTPSDAAAKPVVKEGMLPSRAFSDRQLSELSRLSSAIECECPNHMADLLFNLTAFETYCEGCVSRSQEDAEIHAYLHRMTANARSTMEEALTTLIEFEGIQLKES